MSIRPNQNRRPVTEVLAEGLAKQTASTPLALSRPVTRDDLPSAGYVLDDPFSVPFGFVGKVLDAVVTHLNERCGVPASSGSSCCEDAASSRAEVELLTRARNNYRNSWHAACARAEKAEAERDELQAKLDARPREAEGSRTVNASGDSPSLDREAVVKIIEGSWEENGRGELEVFHEQKAVDAIMALVPSSWPEWLGPKPWSERLEGGWLCWNCYPFARQKGDQIMIGSPDDGPYEVNAGEAREFARCLIGAAEAAEQAAADDEDQRVEELFELVTDLIDLEPLDPDLAGSIHDGCRAAVNAKWTPPESEATV